MVRMANKILAAPFPLPLNSREIGNSWKNTPVLFFRLAVLFLPVNNKQTWMFALECILLSICFQMQQTNIWNALVKELLGPQVII